MTEKEILEIAKRKYPTILEFNLFSKLYGKEITVNISVDQNKDIEISQNTLQALTDFQNLPNSEIENIENQIWNHCLGCFRSQKYSLDGGITWEESKLENNLKEVGITNKKNAIEKSEIKSIYIDNDSGIEEIIFSIQIEIEWDIENGMRILYYDGKFDSVE